MGACFGVNLYTNKRNQQVIYTAFTENFVTKTLEKCWHQLDYANTETEGGFKHLRQAVNQSMQKKASKKDSEGNETGFMSMITGIVADKANKVRGDRTELLVYEEAGSDPYLIKKWIQGDALIIVGGNRIGTKIAYGCVCAGTKVWNKYGQQINIEDITENSGIIGFNQQTGKSSIENITYIQEPAYKDCVKISTPYGYLECSEDHPILCRFFKQTKKGGYSHREYWYDWKQAKDVKKGDFVVSCDKIDVWGEETLFDAYLVGALIGDGTYGLDKTPKLSNCDEEIKKYVKSKYECKIEKVHETKDKKLYEEFRILNIVSNLREIGIYGQTKTDKRLPNNFQSLTKEDTVQLLAGLFDTDGCVQKSKREIVLTQSSKELLKQVQIILYKLGIYSTIRKVEPTIKEGRKDKNPWFILTITDTLSYDNFAEQIPIKIQYKKDRLNFRYGIRSSVARKNLNEGYREIRVTNNESIGNKRIYNLTANNTHTYIANNIVTHNTGGDQGPAVDGINELFYKPYEYDILPYKHNYTSDGQYVTTSYFIPAYNVVIVDGIIDKRGVCDSKKAKAYYQKLREKKAGSPSAYLTYCAEYCFTPEEALSLQGDNIFDQTLIAARLTDIKLHGAGIKPKIGIVDYASSESSDDLKLKFIPDSRGKVRIYEMPRYDEDGKLLKNLYVAGIDSIDQGKDQSTGQKDTSEYCLTIKRRTFGLEAPKYVCIYKERPDNIRKAYSQTIKLLEFYGCQAVLESSRTAIVNYFKDRKKQNLLMRRPTSVNPTDKLTNTTMFGVYPSKQNIEYYLELISDYIMEYSTEIDDIEMLTEMNKYSYENKRKFDIIASMGMTEIGDQEMRSWGAVVKKLNYNKMKPFGYWYDDNGVKHYGVKPQSALLELSDLSNNIQENITYDKYGRMQFNK